MKETVDMVPAFLQYGALGLLALVLLGAGFGFYFFLTYLKELIEVVRTMGANAAAGLAGVETRLETLVERQESTIDAVDRLERASTLGHQATQNQLLMVRRSASPYPWGPGLKSPGGE